MKIRSEQFLRVLLIVGGFAWAGLGCAKSETRPLPTPSSSSLSIATRASMAEVVSVLQVALPLALEEESFRAAENRAALSASFERLEVVSAVLETQAPRRDAGFAHYSHSFARDAEEISRRFSDGRVEEARYFVNQLVDHCVGCHSRLPAPASSALGRSLFESAGSEALSLEDRIRLLMATRQFDQALTELEGQLRDPALHPADQSPFAEDYLRISIRVRSKTQEAERVLATWQADRELPAYLEDLVSTWRRSLEALPKKGDEVDELERARALMREARLLRRFPTDRRPLVFDFAASGALHSALADGGLSGDQRAEAYFLLGLAEMHPTDTDWLAASEFYLESAIREAPGTDWAQESYLLLEEEVTAGYSGSAGSNLPRRVQEWLDELRGLARFPGG